MLLLSILGIKPSVFSQFPDNCSRTPMNQSFAALHVSEESLSNDSTKQRFSGFESGLSFSEARGQSPQFLQALVAGVVSM